MLNLKNLIKNNPTSTGQQAEMIAQHYLEKHGLVCITKNYRCRRGEIDLIMKDKNTLAFIEVRYRTKNSYGTSAESVTRHKQRKLIMCAEYYLHTHTDYRHYSCRFDVMALCQDHQNTSTLHIDWIKHAFDAF